MSFSKSGRRGPGKNNFPPEVKASNKRESQKKFDIRRKLLEDPLFFYKLRAKFDKKPTFKNMCEVFAPTLMYTENQAKLATGPLEKKYCLVYIHDSTPFSRCWIGQIVMKSDFEGFVLVAFHDGDYYTLDNVEARCGLIYDNMVPDVEKEAIKINVEVLRNKKCFLTLKKGTVEEAQDLLEEAQQHVAW